MNSERTYSGFGALPSHLEAFVGVRHLPSAGSLTLPSFFHRNISQTPVHLFRYFHFYFPQFPLILSQIYISHPLVDLLFCKLSFSTDCSCCSHGLNTAGLFYFLSLHFILRFTFTFKFSFSFYRALINFPFLLFRLHIDFHLLLF